METRFRIEIEGWKIIPLRFETSNFPDSSLLFATLSFLYLLLTTLLTLNSYEAKTVVKETVIIHQQMPTTNSKQM